MTDAAQKSEEPDPEIVEALAKQIFRSENPPSLLWDTKLFERSGRSTEGMTVATDATKESYLERARGALLSGGR